MTRASLPSRSPKTASPARIVERFAATEVTATLRRELLDDAGAFASLLEAQAALDDWVREYNAERPHQAHETRAPVTPTQRFEPVAQAQRELLPLWLPGALAQASEPTPTVEARGGAFDVDRTVSISAVVSLAGRQVLAAEILRGRRVAIGSNRRR
jgi:hypothetical protein